MGVIVGVGEGSSVGAGIAVAAGMMGAAVSVDGAAEPEQALIQRNPKKHRVRVGFTDMSTLRRCSRLNST
jgi:hypothetical protein